MAPTTLRVNGRGVTVDVASHTPLLWILRDVLGLTGAKFGCGLGQCGACTVHLAGAPIRSCTVTASSVGQREVTTIEGLDGAQAERLFDAWQREDVVQCGYCQPGQIMSAAALLARVSSPTDDDIDAAMSGNICRCGTYGRIRRAIHRAAIQGASR